MAEAVPVAVGVTVAVSVGVGVDVGVGVGVSVGVQVAGHGACGERGRPVRPAVCDAGPARGAEALRVRARVHKGLRLCTSFRSASGRSAAAAAAARGASA